MRSGAFAPDFPVLILVTAFVILLFVYRDTEYGHDLWWQFEFSEEAPRGLRALLGLAIAASALALSSLLRPAHFRTEGPTKEELERAVAITMEQNLADANLDLVTDIIACPGLDYCSLANARSIPVAQKIAERFADYDRQQDIGELKIKISGCINACGHHHAGHIGILGVDRKGTENYQLLLGGSGDENTTQAKITGPGFTEDGVVDAVERVTDKYLAVREEGERFLDTYRRVGFEPFKEAIYG